MKKCMGCMRDYSDTCSVCPACGYSEKTEAEIIKEIPDAIRPETILDGRYIIGKVMSDTPFSFVYLAWDALLQQRVAIKEYFPERYCSRSPGETEVRFFSPQEQVVFEKGKNAFEREARLLNASQDIPGIVNIYRCLNENNTAYLVMEYLEGISLQDSVDWYQEALNSCEDIMQQLIDLIEQIHARGITHHNLTPDNIYLESDGTLRLLDFGNAKREVYQLSSRPLPIYEDSFIAPEILDRLKAGPGADLYSLGALYYYLETGKEPPASVKKRKKKRLSVGDSQKDRMIQFLMEPDPAMRPESIAQFRKVYPYI